MRKYIFVFWENNVSTNEQWCRYNHTGDIFGRTVTHISSISTINNVNVERLILSQKQIGQDFAKKEYATLMNDETTNFSTKLEGFHTVDMDGRTQVLVLREIQSKAAADVFQTLQEIVEDVNERAKATDLEISRKILCNITPRMSDRAAIEMKFTDLLQGTKEQLLPLIKEGFIYMSNADQEATGHIVTFYCSLHRLIHLAECAASSLVDV